MLKDSLGDRMKQYEAVSKTTLVRRMPAIIRLDGKAFHTFTKGFDRPFDESFNNVMVKTTEALCKEIQNVVIAYKQSDEISLVLVDYQDIQTQAWFDNEVQKMVSTSAALATLYFNKYLKEKIDNIQRNAESYLYGINIPEDEEIKMIKLLDKRDLWERKMFKASFDSRVFNLPLHEVVNYLIWRQKDATRNSINSLAQTLYPHKEIQGIGINDLQNKMLTEKNVNWNNYPTIFKRGCCVIKKDDGWAIDENIPVFTENREYIDSLVYTGELIKN